MKVLRSPVLKDFANMLAGFLIGIPSLLWVLVVLFMVVYVLALKQLNTYPHPPIPVPRQFFVFLCFAVFASMKGNPEVGGGHDFWGS